MSRREAREYAMKLLYEYSITGELKDPQDEGRYSEIYAGELDSEDIEYVKSVISDFVPNCEEIDGLISLNSHSWRIERISKVDLAILRLAIFEIKYMNVPPKVAVNEAVELAKKYSTDKSYKYINGLLGGYIKSDAVVSETNSL